MKRKIKIGVILFILLVYKGIGQELVYLNSNSFDLSKFSFDSSFSVNSEEVSPQDVEFNIDGSKMFVIGSTSDNVVEYDLSTNFDVSTATLNSSFSISAQETNANGMSFNNTGSKLFIIGTTGDDVNEYALSTNFDISTASYTRRFSVSSQENQPRDVAFSADGETMFIIGSQNKTIYQYTLTTGFDISTATYSLNSFSVNSQDTKPLSLTFNYDGNSLYVMGNTNKNIIEYSLSTAYDISVAPVFSRNFSVNSQDTNPTGIIFSSDGTRMFVSGNTSDNIYEYQLNDFANYIENAALNNGTITSGTSMSIKIIGDTFIDLGSGQLTEGLANQVNITNSPAGLTPVLTLSSNNTIVTLSYTGTATSHQVDNDISNLIFTFNNSAFLSNDASSVNNSSTYSSNTGVTFIDNLWYLVYIGPNSFNIENIEYKNTFSVNTQEVVPQDIEFNLDGSKMYVIGSDSKNVNEYSLSTNFDTSTATLNTTFSVSPRESYPTGLAFNKTGDKMFVIGLSGDDVNEYDLSVPFDISTAVYSKVFSVSTQDTQPRDVVFSSNGESMFVIGTSTGNIFEYSLTTGYDVSTATYTTNSYSFASEETSPRSISFNYDGTRMFILGSSGDDINEYSLSAPYNISSPTFLRKFSVANEDSLPFGFAFNTNGTKIFVVGDTNNSVYEYNIVSGFLENTTTNNGNLIGGQSLEIYIIGATFDDTDADNMLSIGSGGADEVEISNIPSGLTATLSLSDSDTKATLTFSGTATDHSDLNDVSSLDFNFVDGAFVTLTASQIDNAVSYTSNIGVEFNFCLREIRYINGDWIGGSGTGGRPNTSDDDKGIYINDDVTLDATVDCSCLEISTGNALSLNTAQNIEISSMLKINGELRLIGGAQIIQTHTGNSNVEGSGNLYIDQTSKTTDLYGLSYWSSPVSNNGSSTYTVQGILRDGTTPTSAVSTPGTITYVSGPDGDTGPPIEIASTWIYGYLNGTDVDTWVSKGNSGSFNPGEGFSMKSPQGSQNYTFLGTPNDGDYSFTVSASNYSLLGNPYPSALDSDNLFSDNAALATLYFWEHKSDDSDHETSGYQGGYGVRTAGGGTAASTPVVGTGGLGVHTYTAPDRYIPVGQGFFVEATGAGGTITFNNSQRNYRAIGDDSVFFKTSNSKKDDDVTDDHIDVDDVDIEVIDPADDVDPVIETPMLKIGFEYKNTEGVDIHRQVGVTFKDGNSFSYDNGYEAIVYDLDDSDMYFKFSNDDNKYVIAGIQKIEENIEIPLAIKIGSHETVKVMIDTTNYITDKNFFLLDKVNNSKQNLNDTVTLSLSKEVTYNDRFFIKIENKNGLSTEDETIINKDISLFYNSLTKEITIDRKNIELKSIQLFNVLGKRINQWDVSKNSSQKIKLYSNNKPNLYILKINTDKGSLTKKILIK